MLQGQTKTRRHFTEAAREAALARRREIAAMPKDPTGKPALFIVRGGERSNDYAWEIRRFGAIVVARSSRGFKGLVAARHAGEEALRGIGNA